MLLIKDPLVRIMGNERFEKLQGSRTYRFMVDAIAMNAFSFAICTPNELLIAGMDFEEYIRTRLTALVLNTFTGRPYGVWRDWLIRKCKISKESPLGMKYVGDTVAFMGFQLPLYWLSMTVGRAELTEMISASIAGLTGRPYGVWLDKFRNECGLTTGKYSAQHIARGLR
ncbi:MAG: L-alanine exporter AlaE [Deltaproteobacteria bacterium]|nr:L-alanine exporter AlaE [Deltaproteobacteria bacterium]